MKATTEKAFEAYAEETLLQRGWEVISNGQWDRKRALFPDSIIGFIRSTQADTYNQMVKLHGSELDGKIMATLVKERETKGTLHILRHGFKF